MSSIGTDRRARDSWGLARPASAGGRNCQARAVLAAPSPPRARRSPTWAATCSRVTRWTGPALLAACRWAPSTWWSATRPWGAEMDLPLRDQLVASLGMDHRPHVGLLGGVRRVGRDGRSSMTPGYVGLVLPGSVAVCGTRPAFAAICRAHHRARGPPPGTGMVRSERAHGHVPTVRAQGRACRPDSVSMEAVLLSGRLRRSAIEGRLLLEQEATQRGRSQSYRRALDDSTSRFEAFRGERDDLIVATMTAASTPLAELCGSGRGRRPAGRWASWTGSPSAAP
jgi:hypothetical protein